MADAIAVVSVAASSTVAIVVPFISARLERQRLRHQGHQAQIDELRALLDESAVHLTEALALLYDLHMPDVAPERRNKAGADLPSKADQLLRDGIRLSLRLGNDHDIKVAHQVAEQRLMGVEAKHRGGELIDHSDIELFAEAMGGFIAACPSVVGVQGLSPESARRAVTGLRERS